LSFKPYPCCRYIHPFIDAALAIVKENDILPEKIKGVIVFVGETAYQALCQPLEVKRAPRNVVEAQFSIPYTVANAIVKRRVAIPDFKEEAIRERATLEIAHKVVPKLAPELTTREISPAIVQIEINDGKVYSKRVDFALGDPRNPMNFEDIMVKFRACAAEAIKPLSEENVEELIKKVARLEQLDDVAHVVRLLNHSSV
ncbi:MAG: hypothetical protein SU899_04630, partial [Chloroflexota bacterium]|nr:hypothetical protein [Chloroflexota bacterium]